MRVTCQICQAEVEPSNIDLTRNISQCDRCGEIFNCADQLDAIVSFGSSAPVPGRPEVSLPQNFKVAHGNGGLLITIKWMSPAMFALLFFCIIWDGFMIFWYILTLGNKIWVMAAFGIPFALVGIGLTYSTILGFVNRTEILISHEKLTIQHLPLPCCRESKEILSAEIAQLYTMRHVSHSDNGTSTTYDLRMKTTHGKDQTLIKNLSEQDHGLYIEQQIERFLGLADEAVPGEVERIAIPQDQISGTVAIAQFVHAVPMDYGMSVDVSQSAPHSKQGVRTLGLEEA